MFLENSRYFGQKTMAVKLADGSTAQALQPRRLPAPASEPLELKVPDRLDILAQRLYLDSTRFWHVADANTRVEARLLTDPPPANAAAPPVQIIQVPRK